MHCVNVLRRYSTETFPDLIFAGGFNSLLVMVFAENQFYQLTKLAIEEKNPICDIALHGSCLVAVNGEKKLLSWNFQGHEASHLLKKANDAAEGKL